MAGNIGPFAATGHRGRVIRGLPIIIGRFPWTINYSSKCIRTKTGRPQPAIIKPAEAGQIHGSVLDVGCGTGENLLTETTRGQFAVFSAPTQPFPLPFFPSAGRRRRMSFPWSLEHNGVGPRIS